MSRSLDLVYRLNSVARSRDVADSIVQFENVATQAQYRLPYEIAGRYVKSGAKVLDWGCGNGHFSLFLESLGAVVTGYSYEPPPRAMARSTTFQFVPGVADSPAALPFADGTFDVTIGVGVLEHVWEIGGDERASLAELARVTRPGGAMLTFHLPNRTGWIEPVTRVIRPNAHYHKRKYGRSEIVELWNEAGFDVVEIRRYNALPRNQIRGLPRPLRHSAVFASVYEVFDGAIARVFPAVCTNFGVVGRRRPS